jgi:hypothetical protein
MRMLIMLAAAVVIVAIGFGVKAIYIPGSVNVVAATTLSPHEIHLNYKGMKELPIHEIKEPF